MVFDTFYLGPRAKQRKRAPGPEEAAVSSEQPAPNKEEQLREQLRAKGVGVTGARKRARGDRVIWWPSIQPPPPPRPAQRRTEVSLHEVGSE